MFDLSSILPILQLLVQAGGTAYQAANRPSAADSAIPTPTPVDPSAAIRKQLMLTRPNAAANLGGGISPEFLQAMAASDAGYPGASDLGLLEELRRGLGQGNVQA